MGGQCKNSALQNFAWETEGEEGTRLAQEMSKLGYEHTVYAPSFNTRKESDCVFGNAIFSRRPLQDHKAPANSTVTMDLDRKGYYPGVGAVGCTRSAAVAAIRIGHEGGTLEPALITIVSAHLDVLAEFGTYFGLAEGEFVRLLEFENLHHAVRELPNAIVAGDFNAPAKSTTICTPLHRQMGRILEQLGQSRDAFNQRHFIPAMHGEGPRLKEEWCLTALEFAEHRLQYQHAWQTILQLRHMHRLPLYSHWSGQLIDHCLIRDPTATRPDMRVRMKAQFVGVFHSDASDHLPLVFDLEFTPAQ